MIYHKYITVQSTRYTILSILFAKLKITVVKLLVGARAEAPVSSSTNLLEREATDPEICCPSTPDRVTLPDTGVNATTSQN